jgi:DNA-binding transcriptional LysR family regulator
LDADRYEMVELGQEVMGPYAKPRADGQPMFQLPGTASAHVPYLGYAPGAYLGRIVDLILKSAPVPIHLDRVYETDMAEGLKAMALAGHGLAFLPHSAVAKELREQLLVRATSHLWPHPDQAMLLRAYRVKPARANATNPKTAAHALWAFLQHKANLAAQTLPAE